MDPWTGHEVPGLPGDGRPLSLYDASRQGVFPVTPTAAPASMYVCGITPYDATHLATRHDDRV